LARGLHLSQRVEPHTSINPFVWESTAKQLPVSREVFAQSKEFVAGCNFMVISERQSLRIFVVDDEEFIAHSLAHILRKEGFDVTAFTNPLNALEHMKLAEPDLLISDVMMPQLSGIELARQTQTLAAECKVLLFSAAADDLLREAGGEGLGFRLLPKPLHPTALLDEIAALTAASPVECF
jgi:CheY-like chemotaxis protein